MPTRSLGYSTIVAFGDSITHGYQTPKPQIWTTLLETHLQQALSDRAADQAPHVINAGVGGNTSAEGLARFDRDVEPHLPALVLVEFGGNDTVSDPARHVPLDAFEANLRQIHRKITTRYGRVIFMSFPPVINAWHSHANDPIYRDAGGMDEHIQHYREKTRQLAEILGCAFFDLDKVLRDAITEHGPRLLVEPDGVHLTPQAHQLVATALATFLTARL